MSPSPSCPRRARYRREFSSPEDVAQLVANCRRSRGLGGDERGRTARVCIGVSAGQAPTRTARDSS